MNIIRAELIRTLSGTDKATHPRSIVFLQMPSTDDLSGERLLDGWGNPLRVILDTDYEGRLVIPRGGADETTRQSGGVESAGPDGDFDMEADHVNSWDKVP